MRKPKFSNALGFVRRAKRSKSFSMKIKNFPRDEISFSKFRQVDDPVCLRTISTVIITIRYLHVIRNRSLSKRRTSMARPSHDFSAQYQFIYSKAISSTYNDVYRCMSKNLKFQ